MQLLSCNSFGKAEPVVMSMWRHLSQVFYVSHEGPCSVLCRSDARSEEIIVEVRASLVTIAITCPIT